MLADEGLPPQVREPLGFAMGKACDDLGLYDEAHPGRAGARYALYCALLATLNSYIWHEYVLYAIVGTGVLFTIWSGFSQYRALTHGPAVIRGVYDDPNDPGAINHFQALSAALSATVGLGNIGNIHARVYQARDDVEIVAVCDILHDRADKAAAAYNCPAFYSIQEMLESGIQIDAASMCTAGVENGGDHYQATVELLEGGLELAAMAQDDALVEKGGVPGRTRLQRPERLGCNRERCDDPVGHDAHQRDQPALLQGAVADDSGA